jgi:PEP-CTERM motif-containing protein
VLDFPVTATPEPAGLSLLGIGLFAIAAKLRRKTV